MILIEPHYDQAADIWSLGCILVELIQLSEGNNVERVFNGYFCEPMSPRGLGMSSKNDQLACILRRRGYDEEKDFAFVTNQDAQTYFEKMKNFVEIDHTLQKLISKSDP